MPVTAIINLRALTGGKMPRSFHCLMHPIFLDRISAAHSGLGAMLHDHQGPAPYAISPIMGRKANGAILNNESYWVRLSILHPDLEDVFLTTLEQGLWVEPVSVGDLSFLVEDVVLGQQPSTPWSGRAGYDDLLRNGLASDRITLHFKSPVSFKRGDLHYSMPEPGLIFGHLVKRWNRFAPDLMPENLTGQGVSYSFFDIHTAPYALRNGGTILGAVGQLTFIFECDVPIQRLYRTLLRFAFYSGIGVKTTQGMGLCRVIEER
ncbi:MAG: CRISPR-associated endoribonuclease Cas6 [Deltaproteobacteria bacterium]|nr:CRISPR-associated endoribonuclease Cas6 [Deltaproteobacteria bacterium]